MLTVAQLAKELNVSVQTIYRTLNSAKQCETEELTEKIKGITYFTSFGEKIIRENATPVKQNEEECFTPLNTVEQVKNDEISFLREQNERLLRELEQEREHSRKQAECMSERITDLAEKLVELTRNSQILLKQEQDKNTALIKQDEQPPQTEAENTPKENILKRIFNKKENKKNV